LGNVVGYVLALEDLSVGASAKDRDFIHNASP